MVPMADALAKLDSAHTLLAEARMLKDVKELRDKAAAAMTWVKAARKGREAELYAAEIYLLASHKAGRILADLPRAKPKAKGGRVGDSEYEQTLKESRVNYRTAQHWQELARIPEEEVRGYIEHVRETETGEITAQGLLRTAGPKPEKTPNLADLYVVPPFSVLDPTQDYWKKRKLEWTSIFDPVLWECMVRWFAPTKQKGYGQILDPFSGGSTRGILAAYLGYKYTGVECHGKVETNIRQARAVIVTKPFSVMPQWVDSIESLPDGEMYDLVCTSAPGYDKSRWSSYQEFLDWTGGICQKALRHLKQNRFVVVAVEEMTDEDGFIRGFTPHLVRLFESFGAKYYDEIVMNSAPELPMWMYTPHAYLKILCFWNGDRDDHLIPEELGVLEKKVPVGRLADLSALASETSNTDLKGSVTIDVPVTEEKARGVPVHISSKSARIRFQGCSPDYITSTCHGKCCETTDPVSKQIATRIPITKSDLVVLQNAGFDVPVVNGLMSNPPGQKCRFKEDPGFCSIHASGQKPFGCWISPFHLRGKRRTLMIRKRYIGMKCHTNFRDTGPPAYKAFATSLRKLFGDAEAARITAHLDGGGGDLVAEMLPEAYALHMENERSL